MAAPDADTQFDNFARKFRWIRRILAADAGGFVFFGGELDPADFGLSGYEHSVSLSGKGTGTGEAFAACVGEGIEHLSRLEWGDEEFVRGSSRTVDHGLDEASLADIVDLSGYNAGRETPELDWMPAVRLSDGVSVKVPAAICIRRPATRGAMPIPSAISTGCAAGPTLEAAILAALLELIERDAVALWWMGGRRGRPFGLNALARTGAAELLQQLRQGGQSRPTWLLNLTSDIGIPCVAALSATAEGRGFACGTAARLTAAEAVRAALLELCQSELGHHLVAAKRNVRGDQALNEVDRRKLDRAHNLDACSCALLHAAGFPEEVTDTEPTASADAIRIVVETLQRRRVEPLLVDLTRSDLPVPAARVIGPGLQPFPSSLMTDRLGRMTADLGTYAAKTPGIPLF
jgi:ribosomal protein S12 methylthiotransferase accessory factor